MGVVGLTMVMTTLPKMIQLKNTLVLGQPDLGRRKKRHIREDKEGGATFDPRKDPATIGNRKEDVWPRDPTDTNNKTSRHWGLALNDYNGRREGYS